MALHARLRKILGALATVSLLALPSIGLGGGLSAPAHASPSAGPVVLDGVWYNENHATRDITHLVITGFSGQYIRTYGACEPVDCDWGVTRLYRTGIYSYYSIYNFSFATVRVSLYFQGPFLRVIDHTHYIDHSGRTDQTSYAYFVNPAASGRWINIDPQTRSIRTLYMSFYQDGSEAVSVFGACEPADCAWGTRSLSGTYPLYAHYTFSFAVKYMTLRGSGPYLYTTTYTHFTDGSGRQDYQSNDTYYYAV
jgi:hypothetical protein